MHVNSQFKTKKVNNNIINKTTTQIAVLLRLL
jgi:hypothetical protein